MTNLDLNAQPVPEQSMSLNEEAKRELDVYQWLRMAIYITSKEFTWLELIIGFL